MERNPRRRILSISSAIAADSLIAVPVLDDSTLTGTVRQVGPLFRNTRYYWHVASVRDGKQSDWTPAWSFAVFSTVHRPNALAVGNKW